MSQRMYATLKNVDMPDHQVEILPWDFVDDAVEGYVKVRNAHGWVNVVKSNRLTNHRARW